MLTGDEIQKQVASGNIWINPFDGKRLNANSYDVQLAPTMVRLIDATLDLKIKPSYSQFEIPEQGHILYPGECYLGVTHESTYTPYHIPIYEGRSTPARYFLSSHQTAGFGDLGFFGPWTLEITVQKPTVVYPWMRIGQIAFYEPTGSIEISYEQKGHYADAVDSLQRIPQPPKADNF